MRLSRRSAVGLVMMNALAATAKLHAVPQASTNAGQRTIPELDGHNSDPSRSGPVTERMRASAEKAHNDDRHKRMLADTDKLLALSTELKEYIEKTSNDELSMDVIRKAAEIEKLAHDVQQRMKN